MSEENAIEIMKDYIQDFTCDGGKYPYLVDSMKLIIRLVEKQQKEIEKLKTDKKNASEYIREEMYVDTNPTICEMEDEENTIIELPISLNLYNEDLRKLCDLLEEE